MYDIYSKRTESGYDYHQSFRRACRAFFYKGAPHSDVVANIQTLKKDTEREDNSACFDAAVAVLPSIDGSKFLPPSGYIVSPLKRVRIKLSPTLQCK